jgi:hypothetical protein
MIFIAFFEWRICTFAKYKVESNITLFAVAKNVSAASSLMIFFSNLNFHVLIIVGTHDVIYFVSKRAKLSSVFNFLKMFNSSKNTYFWLILRCI